MHPHFRDLTESLEPSFRRLMEGPPTTSSHQWGARKTPGVYLFSEGETALYVGRTNDLRSRYKSHHGQSVKDSPLAFRLAREVTGFVKPTYQPGEGSRKSLLQHPTFSEAYAAQKVRIAAMDWRYVVEADPIRQCLLEVYCAVVLKTSYNDFDNH